MKAVRDSRNNEREGRGGGRGKRIESGTVSEKRERGEARRGGEQGEAVTIQFSRHAREN